MGGIWGGGVEFSRGAGRLGSLLLRKETHRKGMGGRGGGDKTFFGSARGVGLFPIEKKRTPPSNTKKKEHLQHINLQRKKRISMHLKTKSGERKPTIAPQGNGTFTVLKGYLTILFMGGAGGGEETKPFLLTKNKETSYIEDRRCLHYTYRERGWNSTTL